MNKNHSIIDGKLTTLELLKHNVLAGLLDPIPPDKTLRRWFEKAGIRNMQANGNAKRGGGAIWYSVSDVQRWLTSCKFENHRRQNSDGESVADFPNVVDLAGESNIATMPHASAASSLIAKGIPESSIFCNAMHTARICGCSPTTILKWVSAGRIIPDAWSSNGYPLFKLNRVAGEIFALFNPTFA